jgi:DUF4097 and DUF4098 domain-containing protein YvlB
MRHLLLALGLALPLAALAAGDEDISKVNGSVHVEAGQHVGEASSVNGSVHLGRGAVAQKAGTVSARQRR